MHCVHRNKTAPAGLPSSALITGSAVHEFDISRWLLADELTAITAHRGRSASQAGSTRDPLLLVAETAAGTLIDIEVFVNSGYGYEVRCELVGERGTVTLDAPEPTVRRAGNGVARGLPDDWRPRFAEAYRRELQAWIAGLQGGAARSRTWPPPGTATAPPCWPRPAWPRSTDRSGPDRAMPDKPELYR